MKNILKLLTFSLFIIVCAFLNCFGQGSNVLRNRCPNPYQTTYSSLILQANGNINATPCPTAQFLVNGLPVSGGGASIGGAVTGGTSGSILFVNPSNVLAQNNNTLFWNNNLYGNFGALKIQDKNYVPFAGVLNADNLFSNASNDNIQNNIGLIQTSNHFVSFSNDVKIDASGANKFYFGQINQLRLTGAYTGQPTVYGFYNSVNNRGNLTANPDLHGIYNTVSIEGNATTALGIDTSVFKGSAVAANSITGLRSVAQGGYTNTTDIIGGEFNVATASGASTVTLGRGVRSWFNNRAGHTFTTARGVSIDNWINLGTIENSVGLFIDDTHNIGTVTNYAIRSDSTAQSRLLGQLLVGNSEFVINSLPNDTVGQFQAGDCTTTITNCIDINQASNRIFITSNANTYLRFNDVVPNRVTLGGTFGTVGQLDIIGTNVSLVSNATNAGSVQIGNSASAITANAATDTMSTTLGTWNFGGANGVTTFQYLRTITGAGVTGDQVINQSNGAVNFAAAATSLTVTNSTVSANSLINAVAQTNDATCSVKNVVAGAGSFVINMTAACTAETRVAFWVTN